MSRGYAARGQLRIAQMLLDEGLDRGEQGMPARLRRTPVIDVHLVRQPGRENLQGGGGEPGRFGRAVVIDVSAELEKEPRGQIAQPGGGRNAGGRELR